MEIVNVIDGKKLIDEKLGTENFELIDVRSPQEYKQAHIKGAKLLPLEEINQWTDSLDKNKTYLLQCRTGGRSGIAQQMLAAKGFNNVINLMGGIVDWVEEGYDVEED